MQAFINGQTLFVFVIFSLFELRLPKKLVWFKWPFSGECFGWIRANSASQVCARRQCPGLPNTNFLQRGHFHCLFARLCGQSSGSGECPQNFARYNRNCSILDQQLGKFVLAYRSSGCPCRCGESVAGGVQSRGSGPSSEIFRVIPSYSQLPVKAFNFHFHLLMLREQLAFISSDLDGRHSTPLHFASGYNRVQVVEFLLQQGADVHAKDKGCVLL